MSLLILSVLLFFLPADSQADTIVGGTISTDTTWTLAGSPYIVTSSITVQGADGADGITTLTIEPGVEVRVNQNRYLNIGASSGNPGALAAQGTAAEPIVFTSNQASPGPGNWYGIRLYKTTDANTTVLEHCKIQYAGYGNQGALNIQQASPAIRNTTIVHSSSHGIYVATAAPGIDACRFDTNGNYDLYYTGTVGGTVSDCSFNNGLYLVAAGTVDFTGNTFNYNNSYPIKTYADNVHNLVNGNTFANLDASSYLEVSSGNVTKDATWTAAIPYVLSGNITVQGTDGADGITTLTIAPGAVLKFNRIRYLNIGASSGNPGALVAQGTAAEPVVFTSNQASPAPGNWYGIRLYNTTDDATTLLEHCRVLYAGYGNQGALNINQASPSVRNTLVSNSSSYGAYINAGAPAIDGCRFSNNANYDLYYTGTVGGSVNSSTFDGGIYLLAGGTVAFSGNSIHYDNAHPIKVYASQVGALVGGCTFTELDNGSFIEVSAGNITHDATWTGAVPYAITGNITIQGTDGPDGITSLTILPGASLRFNRYRYLNVGASSGNPGALIARGTSAQPITFTSNQAAPAAGDWYGLRFYDTASDAISFLEYCLIQYAGYGNQGAVYLYNAKPRIRNCTLNNNKDKALYINGTGCNGVDILGNTFAANTYGIYTYGNANPKIRFNNFAGNASCGLYNASSVAVMAAYNWWGHAAGPNTGGDKIYGNVEAAPWLGQVNEIPIGTMSTVPDVTGLTQTEAQTQLTVAGLVVGAVTHNHSETVAQGGVISQTPVSGTSVEAGTAVDLLVSLGPTPPPTVSITVSPEAIILGQTATLSWNSNHAGTIGIDNGVGTVASTGTQEISPEQTTTYTITASGTGGSATASTTVVVQPPPTASIAADPRTIRVGQTATISWSSADTESAVIDQGIGPVALSGSMDLSPTETTEYTLTAVGPGGTASAAATISVTYPVPTLSFSVTPAIIAPGQFATLTWSTAYADTCSIDQDIGSVQLSGSTIVAPMQSTTYTMTAQGRGGTMSAAATLTVPANPPAISAGSNASSILLGRSAQLAWTTSHAERCVIEPDIGEVDINGTLTVSPVETTVYTIIAYGSGISATAEVEVAVRLPSLNIINTIAGIGAQGYSGDGGPAVMAELKRPEDIAVDRHGNLYIADPEGYCIRKVDPQGIITTIAGNGSYGYSGDGGAALQARISPYRIVTDSEGKIYFYHSCNTGNAIRKVDTGGIITTVSTMTAWAMAMDSADYLYVASGYQIHKIAPDGTTTVVAGNGSSGFGGDGGPALSARLGNTADLAFDRDGNLYISDDSNRRVRKVDADGIITTVAGGGVSVGDGIAATTVKLSNPESVAVDPLGNFYILEADAPAEKTIRKVDRQGIISTVNGKEISVPARSIGDGGPVEAARLEYPQQIRIDRSGNWYIAEHSRKSADAKECSRVRKVAPSSVFPVLITAPLQGLAAFNPEIEISGLVGPGALVHVNDIQASVIEDTFRVTVSLSKGLNRVLAEASVHGEVTGYDAVDIFYLPEFYGIIDAAADPLSDNPQVFDCPESNPIRSLQAVAVDENGGIYFPFCNRIFKVSSNGVVQVVAGSGIQGYSGDGGPALEAKFNNPAGIAVAGNGNIYIADVGNHRIRKVDADGIIVTVVGTGLTQWNGYAGWGLELNLYFPRDVVLAPSGSLYIADTRHYRVLKLDPNGFCEFVTGQHQWISETYVTRGEYIRPYGLGIDGNGKLYIADTGNQVVWRMDGGLRTIVAGQWCFDCNGSFTDDGGPAVQAWLKRPADVAVDGNGIIYFTEEGTNRVRRVDEDGTLRTVAGDGANVTTGDGGPAQLAQIAYPRSIAIQTDGTIYTAGNDARIRRIRPVSRTTIPGRVIEAATNMPLAGVAVSAEWMSVAYSASTDADGMFAFADIEAFEGSVKITAQYPGYITSTDVRTISGGAIDAPLEIRMYPKPALRLNLTSPSEDALIHTSSMTLEGSASHPARVTVNGLEIVDAEIDFSASLPVADGQNGIFVLARDGYNQTASVQRQVTGAYLEPTADIQASDTEILRGNSTVLSWNTANGVVVQIEPGIGPVNGSGSLTVWPNQTTTYILTAENPPNIATASLTVAVTQLEPVRLNLSPATIDLGQSTTLTWSCRDDHADTVTIEPAIGAVEPVGSMQVAPRGPTTYTITAGGPGGTATASVTVAVNLTPPVVYFSAEPSTIEYGAFTTLSWDTFNADRVTISGLGQQNLSGSKNIRLYKTMSYTLTATGPGGTTTAGVTVTVRAKPPIVSFIASPAGIPVGAQATLSWTVSGADTISIDNGVGGVAASGSVQVAPTRTTTYRLTAVKAGVSTTAIAEVAVDNPFLLQIEAPADQQIIHRPDVLVRGIIQNSAGRETGITVNGIAALQYGNQFMANHVPLDQGENTITVTAMDTGGNVYSVPLTIHADITGQHCRATTTPEAGLAPFEGELRIAAPVGLISTGILSYGPGQVLYGDGPPEQFPLDIEQPGLYRLEVAAAGDDGRIFKDEVALLVYNRDQLDALLKAKWNAMKTCLAAGDVAGALKHYKDNTRGIYHEIFTALGDRLPQVAQGMQAIELVSIEGGSAKYRIRRTEVHRGEEYEITYYIYFDSVEGGIWKINRY